MTRVLLLAVLCGCTQAIEEDALAPPGEEPPAPSVEAIVPSSGKPTAAASSRELRVAIEGECRTLGVTVLGRDAFAHTSDPLDPAATMIVRLTGGAPTVLPPPPSHRVNARGWAAYPFVALKGRWPDRVYATFVTEKGVFLADGLMHFDGRAWVEVPGFGNDEVIRDVVSWTPDLALAHVLADSRQSFRDELRVVGGETRAPNIAELGDACGDSWGLSHPTVDRAGNLGVAWSCAMQAHLAIWFAGDPKPVTHALPLPLDYGPFAVTADSHGGFFVAYRSGRAAHVDRDGATVVPVPRSVDVLDHFAADPDGRLWIVSRDRVYRQVADGWKRERVPGTGRMEWYAGFEQGRPWIRRKGTFYFHGHQYRQDERIFARGDDGKWHAVAVPRAALAEGVSLSVDFFEADALGRIWALAHGGRTPRDEPPKYQAVLTNADVAEPLRCPLPASSTSGAKP